MLYIVVLFDVVFCMICFNWFFYRVMIWVVVVCFFGFVVVCVVIGYLGNLKYINLRFVVCFKYFCYIVF